MRDDAPVVQKRGAYTVFAGGTMTTRTVLECFGGDFTALGAAAEGHGVKASGVRGKVGLSGGW